MDEKRYSITLQDGTKLENLRLNGDNFISDTRIDASLFDKNCAEVLISDGETEKRHTNMELIQIVKMGEEYWLALGDIPEDELEKRKIRSDIEYIAMMTDVEL